MSFRQATSEVTGENEIKEKIDKEREREDQMQKMWADCRGKGKQTHSLCIN